jgi:stage V sporulation protein SpoVS
MSKEMKANQKAKNDNVEIVEKTETKKENGETKIGKYVSKHNSDYADAKVAANTDPVKLAFFICNQLKDPSKGGVVLQSIGPAANQRTDFAIVKAQSLISQLMPTTLIVVLSCVRTVHLENGEERTAIRKTIFPIDHKLAP